jgi:hypothetical protein
MINNVNNIARVVRHADRAVKDGRINRYVVVNEHAAEALNFFNLSVEDLGRGYVYSISELVSIFLCETDYLLHFAGDCMPQVTINWLDEAIHELDSDRRVKVANLSWDPAKYAFHHTAEAEAVFGRSGSFYLGSGFSDQCYLVKKDDFCCSIYNEYNEASSRYPDYGGELFEKRVDSWMQNHGFIRASYVHGVYDHLLDSPSPWSSFRFRAGIIRKALKRRFSASPD